MGIWDTGQIKLPADWQRRQKKLMLTARADLQTCEWEQCLSMPGLPEQKKRPPFELKWPNCISLVIEIGSPTWACHAVGVFMRVLLSLVSASLLGLHLNLCLQKSLCLNTIASLIQAST